MVNKIIALGKEIRLREARTNLTVDDALSIISDLDPELAAQLRNVQYKTRIEDEALIFYRTGAIFG